MAPRVTAAIRHLNHARLATGRWNDIDDILVIYLSIDRYPPPVRRPGYETYPIPAPRHLGQAHGLTRDVRIDFPVQWNHPHGAIGYEGQLVPIG